MDFKIRKMAPKDKSQVLFMMKEFYSSPVVFTNGSDEIFEADFENCVNNSPFLEGFVFEKDENLLGYAMVAKSFSTEFGKPCIWFEDLYLAPMHRGKGIIPEFVKYIKNQNPDSIFRLEAEKENAHAVYVYKKLGFKELPYFEMIFES